MGKAKLESDIVALAKVKPQASKEGRQKFLGRLLSGLDKLFGDNVPGSDENWEKTTTDIQNWYRAAADAEADQKPLPDFEPVEVAPPAEKPVKDKASAKAKSATNGGHKNGAKNGATKNGKTRAPRARKQDGVIDKILPMCFANPAKGVDEIQEMLAKKNVEAKRATVWSVRVNLIRNCAFLQSIGKLKENPFSASAS